MNFTFLRLILGFIFMVVISHSTFAQTKNRLELGVGGMKSAEYIDFLVKIDNRTTFGETSGQTDFFLIVKVAADAAIGSKQLTYLDFSFEVAPTVDIVDNGDSRLYLGYNLVSFKKQKNIDLDQADHYSLSVVGFRVGGHQNLGEEDLKLFGQLSLDFVSVLFDSKRNSDSVGLSGKEYGKRSASGLSAFLGIEKKDKFRVVLGADIVNVYALGEEVVTSVSCTDYVDDYGYYLYTDCSENTSTEYAERWKSSKLYADASVNITKSLSAFGRASYNIFSMTDDTEYFPSSENKRWQLMLGVKYKLFSASRK